MRPPSWDLFGEDPRDIDGPDDNFQGLGDEMLVADKGSGSRGGEGFGVLELKSLVMLFCFFNGFDGTFAPPDVLDDRSWSSPFVFFILASNARLLQFPVRRYRGCTGRFPADKRSHTRY